MSTPLTDDSAAAAPAQQTASASNVWPGVSVVRTPEGGLRIETSPALAAPLAALLESLAQSLRASAPP